MFYCKYIRSFHQLQIHNIQGNNDNTFLTIFINSSIYCWVDSWEILADVLWITKVHNPSVFIVTEKKKEKLWPRSTCLFYTTNTQSLCWAVTLWSHHQTSEVTLRPMSSAWGPTEELLQSDVSKLFHYPGPYESVLCESALHIFMNITQFGNKMLW